LIIHPHVRACPRSISDSKRRLERDPVQPLERRILDLSSPHCRRQLRRHSRHIRHRLGSKSVRRIPWPPTLECSLRRCHRRHSQHARHRRSGTQLRLAFKLEPISALPPPFLVLHFDTALDKCRGHAASYIQSRCARRIILRKEWKNQEFPSRASINPLIFKK